MAGCEPQVYEGVTETMLHCLSQSIETAFGLALDSDQGTASAMGTTLEWNYDRSAQQLTLTCAAKPMFLPCSSIYEHLGKMLDHCRS